MIVDIIVVFAFVFFAFLGYSRGLIKSAASLVRVSASVIIAFILSNPLASLLNGIFKMAKWFSSIFGTDEKTGWLILVAFSAILIFIAIRLVLNMVVKFAEKAREKERFIGTIDKWLGALFGVLRFMFLFSILAIVFYIVTKLPFLSDLHDTVFSGSKVALWLYDFVTNTILTELLAAASQYVSKS